MSRFNIDRKKAGIYRIINLINNKVYIGSAISFRKRWNTHLYDLLNNKHHSILLQRAWDKNGENTFKFEIIEEIVDLTKLIEREQFWLDYYKSYDPEKGYNVGTIAGSRLGVKHSDETKKLFSSQRLGNKWAIGNKHTEEFKEKQRIRQIGNTNAVGHSHLNPRKGTTIITKNCPQCNVEIVGPRGIVGRQKFCSQKCSHNAYKGKHYNV